MPVTPEQPTAEDLKRWFSVHLAHFNAGRFDAYFDDLADEVVYVLGPSLRLSGKADVISWYRSRFGSTASHSWDGALEFHVSGETGIAEGRFETSMQDEAGDVRTLGGKVMLVFRWDGATWLKLAEHVILDPE